MDIIKVVCGIIYRNDEVFICRRKPNRALGGFWEFPGGKIEPNETFEDALCRELIEELGMKISIDNHFKTVVYDYPQFAIELISYRCQFQEATFKMTDHDAYEWVKINDLHNWQLAPADILIVEEMI